MMRKYFRITLFVSVAIFIPFSLFAQAWVSPKGTGSISISYLNNLDNRDYFGRGEPFNTFDEFLHAPPRLLHDFA